MQDTIAKLIHYRVFQQPIRVHSRLPSVALSQPAVSLPNPSMGEGGSICG
jgi:hypothetical protein